VIRKGFIGLILVASSTLCFGQQPKTPAPATNNNPAASDPNAPVMAFETTEHDFGTIDQDANGTYLFLFTNTGKEPLVIKEARGSCGCTVPHWPQHPIAPGAEDTIRVTYDTHRVGVFVKSVTITSNSKESPDVLNIKGKVNGKPQYPAFGSQENNGAPRASNTTTGWDN
jgi:hypothetical protein